MPLTPALWLSQFTANLTTSNNQSDPHILQLRNGNVLVSWTSDDDGGTASPSGTDLVGQIFDPLGNLVGTEISINNSFIADNERSADIAALPDGGFIAVFVDADLATDVRSLRIETYNATGTLTNSNAFVDDTSSTTSNFDNPAISVSATTVMIAYEEVLSPTDTDIVFRIYTPATNTFGTETGVFTSGQQDTDASVATLGNGNYVIVATHEITPGNSEILMRLFSGSGVALLAPTSIGQHVTGQIDGRAHVEALSGGGFVVTWANEDGTDLDVFFQVFNASGNAITNKIGVDDQGTTDRHADPDVVSLPDGGFIVFYDDRAQDGTGGGKGHRYDASGAPVGDTFMISPFAVENIESVLLGDGRVAVTFLQNEIQMVILDTRDAANTPGVYTPEQWQIGTIGNDTILADAVSEFVHGWDGDDVITGSGQTRQYFGGRGDDRLNVVSGLDGDIYDGGDGNDTIDWSAANVSGGTFSLGGNQVMIFGTSFEDMIDFENLIGTANADEIVGTDDANMLDGNGGNDTIHGFAGADTLLGGSGADHLDGGDDGDTVAGGDGNDTLLGAGGADVMDGGSDHDLLEGGEGNDTLLGSAGNDTLVGGTGDDSMSGGAGDDEYLVEDAGDTVSENASEGTETVRATITHTLSANVENLTLLGSGDLSGTGNELDNSILGNSGNNVLNGTSGTDTLQGGASNDTYTTDGSDTIIEAAGEGTDVVQSSATHVLSANVENLTLTGTGDIDGTGNSLNNSIFGNSGNNVLDGGTGSDTMVGGAGNDTYVTNGADTIIEAADSGIDTVQSSVTYALGDNVENLSLLGAANINGTGNALDNLIIGNSGNNLLDGGTGADTLRGGAGSDTYVVTGDDTVVEAASQGSDTVLSNASFTLGDDIENLTLTGTDRIDGTGNTLDNFLAGNSGNNRLDGGTGTDTLEGGNGNDTYVTDGNDSIIEIANNGTDTVESSVSFTLGANLDNLTLTGFSATDGSGNALANVIRGNAQANVLTGGGGNDTLIGEDGDDRLNGGGGNDLLNGGSGIDTAVYSGTVAVKVNLAQLAAQNTGLGFDTMLGIENVVGSSVNDKLLGDAGDNGLFGAAGIDTLIGNAGNDTLLGDAGNDRLDGGAGNDILNGGAGIDTAVFAGRAAIKVNLALSGGQNSGQGTDTLIGIEHVKGGGAADQLLGNAAANKLFGARGSDTLVGNDGNDTLLGDAGNDRLTGGAGKDILSGGTGIDTAVYTGTTAIRVNLTLAGAQKTGQGSDTLISIENIESGRAADLLIGNGFANRILGGGGNDTISGGLGVDTLLGDSGNDRLNGGGASDLLTGGLGSDVFVFNSVLGSGNIDRITDFNVIADTISLEDAIFTGLAAGALATAAFAANSTGHAGDATDRIIYEIDTGKLFFDRDGTGVAAAVQFAVLEPGLALTSADFVVV